MKIAIAFCLFFCGAMAMDLVCPPANLCYVIDESGSISDTQFEQQRDALLAITDQFDALAPGSQYAAVGFSSSVSTVSALTSDVAAFKQALMGNTKSGGNTSSGKGLNSCDMLLDGAPDPRIIVLITDGADNVSPFGTSVAPGIKADGTSIASIGVGNGVSNTDLMSIASTPNLFIPVTNFNALAGAINEIVLKLCTAATPSSTPSPSVSSTPSRTPKPSTTPTASSTPSVSVSATPSTTSTASVTPTPSASKSAKPSSTPSASPLPQCITMDCARCGHVLECYVNSGFPALDDWACKAAMNKRIMCPRRQRTKCDQSCRALRQGIKCFAGKPFGSCPARPLHSKCQGGATRRRKRTWRFVERMRGGRRRSIAPAPLETFASYKVCFGKHGAKIRCKSRKCYKNTCKCLA